MRLTNPKKSLDLRSYYTIFFELGLVGALSIFIIATNIRLTPGDDNYRPLVTDQEIVAMKDVVRTEQQELPPPPPPPQVPVEVPNDRVIEEQTIRFNSELDLDQPLELPQEVIEEEVQKEEVEEEIFVVVEHPPELIGGQQGLYERIVYPPKAEAAGIEGLVIVQFIITPEGTVRDPVIMRSVGGGCDEEALRVIKEARFKPGRQRGVPVSVRYSMPIRFKLRK